jgi:hypothetical protein
MTTGAEPTAVPPATSVKLTEAGVAEMVRLSASVAFRVTLALPELSCADPCFVMATLAAKSARAMENLRQKEEFMVGILCGR